MPGHLALSEAGEENAFAVASKQGLRRTPGSIRRLEVALLVIGTAQLMVVLDATIVNVALPTSSGHSASLERAWSGSSTPTPSPSGGCC